jgi:RimJ/RimL family protein N-acetyltransferase
VTNGPFLVTERLVLTPPAVADRAELHAMTQDQAMQRFLPSDTAEHDSFSRMLRNAGSWALYGYGPLTVRLAGEPAIIGSCGLFHSWRGFGKGMDDVPEAGWSIASAHWGKGYAGEAMAAILAWFDREHGARRMACMIDVENERSHRIAEKLGFVAYGRHEHDGHPVILYQRGG